MLYAIHYHINCYDLVTNIHSTYLLAKQMQQLEGESSVITRSFVERKRNININNKNDY